MDNRDIIDFSEGEGYLSYGGLSLARLQLEMHLGDETAQRSAKAAALRCFTHVISTPEADLELPRDLFLEHAGAIHGLLARVGIEVFPNLNQGE